MWERTDSFEARGESGVVYTVIEHTKVVEHRPLAGRVSRGGGARDYQLSDGTELSAESEGVFKIVQTDEIIRRI